jgi:hypothetical protein
VKQLGPGRQQIQLELWKDGFTGLVYEARADTILPLRSRRAGTLDSLVVLHVHLLFYAGLWFLVWLIRHLLVKSRQRAFAPAHRCLLT